jgi:hypothetical protein
MGGPTTNSELDHLLERHLQRIVKAIDGNSVAVEHARAALLTVAAQITLASSHSRDAVATPAQVKDEVRKMYKQFLKDPFSEI